MKGMYEISRRVTIDGKYLYYPIAWADVLDEAKEIVYCLNFVHDGGEYAVRRDGVLL